MKGLTYPYYEYYSTVYEWGQCPIFKEHDHKYDLVEYAIADAGSAVSKRCSLLLQKVH